MSESHDRPDFKLETYLQGDSKLSRLYQAGHKDTPSPDLDARILGAARAAVENKPSSPSPFVSHWALPLSLAAVLVLTVAIVPLLQDQVAPPAEILVDTPHAGTPAPRADRKLEADAERERDAGLAQGTPTPQRMEKKTQPPEPAVSGSAKAPAASRPAPVAVREKPVADQTPHIDWKALQESAKTKTQAATEADAVAEQEIRTESGGMTFYQLYNAPEQKHGMTDSLHGTQAGEPNPALENVLQSIRELLDQDRQAEAMQAFRQLQKNYPHADLRKALGEEYALKLGLPKEPESQP